MNPLAVGGLAVLNFVAMLILANFVLIHVVTLLRNHPAGLGLAALAL